MKKRRILVTSALPYANGPLHLGHLLEYIQTDVWARFQRLRGHDCIYVCADDAHGSPIMLKAREEGVKPEELIARMREAHLADFAGFSISFDNYHSTHSPENRALAELIFARLDAAGYIEKKTVRQAYDEQAGMFLPDRFIRGDCPKCGAADQYGDCCEVCGASYSPDELVNPRSALSGAPPAERASEHFFFTLRRFDARLRDWLDDCCAQPAIRNKLGEWLGAGLRDWDISRDAPYFGFEIPGAPGKYFYVWLDAPIGYMASFQDYCNRNGLDFDAFWSPDSEAEVWHFIGKDIAYFHTLFWPAMLDGAGFRRPTRVHCHGFVTIERQKMSKSRGTFILARDYLDHLDPEHLRYYFACKLGDGVEDIDFNPEDFMLRVNSDLVGKVVNIASRCASFLHRHFDGRMLCSPEVLDDPLHRRFEDAAEDLARDFEALDYMQAMRRIAALADEANRRINDERPWEIAKRDGASDALHRICSLGVALFARLMMYLKPVLPETARKAEDFLGFEITAWGRPLFAPGEHRCGAFAPLTARVEKKAVAAMLRAAEQAAGAPAADKPAGKSADKSAGKGADKVADKSAGEDAADKPTISYEDFAKLDLRVGRVVAAEAVEGADKLLRLRVDLGGETRTIFAGIKAHCAPDSLPGRDVVVVANLAPRKMRFGVSEGMVLAAGDGPVFLVGPDAGAAPGMRVK